MRYAVLGKDDILAMAYFLRQIQGFSHGTKSAAINPEAPEALLLEVAETGTWFFGQIYHEELL